MFRPTDPPPVNQDSVEPLVQRLLAITLVLMLGWMVVKALTPSQPPEAPTEPPPAMLSQAEQDAHLRQILDLPAWAPLPKLPEGETLTPETIALGRHLFYDRRLSISGTKSCASCHEQALAFTDARAQAIGATGEIHPRGAMALQNLAYMPVLNWANPTSTSLSEQAMTPLFGEAPVEMGNARRLPEILEMLRSDAYYRPAFPAAYPEAEDPYTVLNLTRALAAFQRSLISMDSAYDRSVYAGEPLSPEAAEGRDLFFSERLECFHCHGGTHFTGSQYDRRMGFPTIEFHNNGLYNVDGTGQYPEENTGIHELTLNPADHGRFKAPSLRNIAVTAPYMHDGRLATLEDVIEHYSRGGTLTLEGPNAGDGASSPLKSGFIVGFDLTTVERQALIAFLLSLTDERFLTNPAHANPWPKDHPARGEAK